MTDAELIQRLQAYDEEAYLEVVARYGNALYGYIYSLIGDHSLCEDVLIETHLRMVEHIDELNDPRVSLRPWLYRIAHQVAMTMLAHERRLVGIEDDDRLGHTITDPAIRVSSQLDTTLVRDGLAYLTDEQRSVVLLRFVANQSPEHVADILGKPEQTIKQLQWRALRSLERILNTGIMEHG